MEPLLAFRNFAFFKHSKVGAGYYIYFLNFVIQENDILMFMIRDSLFFPFVNCSR